MKTFVLIAFLLFAIVRLGKTQTIFSNDLVLLLYTGIENPVSVAVQTTTPSNITLKCENGVVKKISNRKFSIKICSRIGRTFLRVYNRNKLIETKEIRVRPVPDPLIKVFSQDNEIFFKETPGVRADIEGFVQEGIKSQVEKFIITIKKNTGDTVKIENFGDYFQTAARNAFDSLQIGETVILSNFEVTVGCETEPRKLTQVLTSVYSGNKSEFRY